MMRLRNVLLAAILLASATAHPRATWARGNGDARPEYRRPNLDFVEKPFGRTGDPKKVTRTIRIEGTDAMRYTPSRIVVRQGENVRLVFRNAGKLDHEAVLGTMADLKEHAELMKKFPRMEHDEPFMTHLAPGQSGEMIWQFTRPGEFHFGCLMPGHLEAGMVGTITVVPPPAGVPR